MPRWMLENLVSKVTVALNFIFAKVLDWVSFCNYKFQNSVNSILKHFHWIFNNFTKNFLQN